MPEHKVSRKPAPGFWQELPNSGVTASTPKVVSCEGQPEFSERPGLVDIYLGVPVHPEDRFPIQEEEKDWFVGWFVGPEAGMVVPEVAEPAEFKRMRYIELYSKRVDEGVVDAGNHDQEDRVIPPPKHYYTYAYRGPISCERIQRFYPEGLVLIGQLDEPQRRKLENIAQKNPVFYTAHGDVPFHSRDWIIRLLKTAVLARLFSQEQVDEAVKQATAASKPQSL